MFTVQVVEDEDHYHCPPRDALGIRTKEVHEQEHLGDKCELQDRIVPQKADCDVFVKICHIG